MVSKTFANNTDVSDDDGENVKKLSREVYLIAQEIKIVKSLASNDLRQRTKQLKKLRKWLNIRANSSSPCTDDDFLRIWKGLFYCMWMSDKPLIQESLAEDLGSLLDCFANAEISAQFFGAFLKTMSLEWFGIDQWRIDKFLMLIRRMLRHMFQVLKDAKWKSKILKIFNKQLTATILSYREAIGLTMHVIDVYLEELAKVSDGNISKNAVVILVKPFVQFLATQKDYKLLSHIRRNIFYHLMWQSEKGREYSEKFNAWKELGFPTESINDLEKVEDEDGELDDDNKMEVDEPETEIVQEKILDPRAGCVDVVMPEIPVDVEPLIKEFDELQFNDITNTKSRKVIREILEKLKVYNTGEFPLGVKKMPRINAYSVAPLVDEKIEALDKFEDELHSTTRKLKQLNKKKRRRILNSIDLNEEGIDEHNFEQMIEKALPKKKPKLSTSSTPDWAEEDVGLFLKSKPQKKNKQLKKEKLKKNKSQEGKQNETTVTTPAKKSKKPKSPKSNENKLNLSNGFVETAAETKSDWEKPLENGEIEYFVPSRKSQVKKANKKLIDDESNPSSLVLNPFAKDKTPKKQKKNILLGKGLKKAQSLKNIAQSLSSTPSTSSGPKRVKIVLKRNIAQKPSEYIQQVMSSPQLPYDSEKRPTKSLLKPNLIPSPINPFYKKKIGLKFNDTL